MMLHVRRVPHLLSALELFTVHRTERGHEFMRYWQTIMIYGFQRSF